MSVETLDDFLATPILLDVARELLNISAVTEDRGSTNVTSQFDPEDWRKSLKAAVVAESILSWSVLVSELVQLDRPDMRWHEHAASIEAPKD